MARYSESYMREHCIDVYFTYRDMNMHVLTDGNLIPERLNDRDKNRTNQQLFAQILPDEISQENVSVQQDYIDSIRTNVDNYGPIPENEILLRMFLPMAQMGYYSYDCVETFENGKGRYKLVAVPDFKNGYQAPIVNVQLPVYDGLESIHEVNGLIVSFIM